MRLALFQPDIPQNLGAAIRLTACMGVALEIIEPCAFPLSDKAIRRAAMDYGDVAQVTRHAGWEDSLLGRGNPAPGSFFSPRAEPNRSTDSPIARTMCCCLDGRAPGFRTMCTTPPTPGW
jgi:tRNA(Leu) C34 or U34 (ribose-2'-O)-methylase TrmL